MSGGAMKSEIDSAHAGADIHFGSLAGGRAAAPAGTTGQAVRSNRPSSFHEPRPPWPP
jgi:hypothetical protein